MANPRRSCKMRDHHLCLFDQIRCLRAYLLLILRMSSANEAITMVTPQMLPPMMLAGINKL